MLLLNGNSKHGIANTLKLTPNSLKLTLNLFYPILLGRHLMVSPFKSRVMLQSIMPKEPLKPLIPLDELKKVVAQIVNAPKEKVERVKEATKRKKS
jgi:hypothetical protein